MSSITLKRIKGREVAQKVSEALELEPDGLYRITVQAEDEKLARAEGLSDVMDIVGTRAQQRGLTSELLKDILEDA